MSETRVIDITLCNKCDAKQTRIEYERGQEKYLQGKRIWTCSTQAEIRGYRDAREGKLKHVAVSQV